MDNSKGEPKEPDTVWRLSKPSLGITNATETGINIGLPPDWPQDVQPIIPLIYGPIRRTTRRLCTNNDLLPPVPKLRSPSPSAAVTAGAMTAAAVLAGSRSPSPVLSIKPILNGTATPLEMIAATAINVASAPTSGSGSGSPLTGDSIPFRSTATKQANTGRLSVQLINAEDVAEQISYELQLLSKQGISPAQHLLNLCRQGQWQTVQNLITYVDWTLFDRRIVSSGSGWTPIMFAAKENRVHIVETLIEMGFDVNARAKDGITALHLACAHSREDMLRCLLVNKADTMIAGGIKKQLPIHILVVKPTQTAFTGLQLVLKSSPDDVRLKPDGDGKIPLFLALEAGTNAMAKELLLVLGKEQLAAKCPPNDDTVLHLLTRKRDFDMFKLLFDCGSDINAVNKQGQTPLHIVSESGDEMAVKMFYAMGALGDVKDKHDKTPLHLATEKGHYKIVDFLIDKYKASIHTRTKDGDTLFHIASKTGPAQMALIFMKKGIPMHMSNKNGAKAIHMAAEAGLADVVKTILQKGEQVDVRTNDGYTALHLATEYGRADVVEMLLGYGASVHFTTERLGEKPLHIAARIPQGKQCADLLLKSGAKVNSQNELSGEAPLHVACRHGHAATVRLLLEESAVATLQNLAGENPLHVTVRQCHSLIAQQLIQHVIQTNGKEAAQILVNQLNKSGESSLHYAANIDCKQIHYPNEDRDMMRLLVQNGGDVTLGTTDTIETPVHYCSRSGNTNVLEEIIGQLPLIDAQVACNKQAKNGWSPLLYASYYGHPDIIRILLQQNARVDVFDDRGRAGLHLAAELGHEDVCEILLEHNAFVNVRNKSGMTPLHLAAKMGFNNMIKQLINNHGALIDAMTLTKQTPLHLAAEYGQLEVSRTLLSLKADINAMDNNSQTPLHLAAQSDHANVVKLFLHAKPELVSVPNKNGYTCAHIAATKGSVAVLKELMKFNQEVVRTARIKKTGSTALHLAAEGGHVKVVRLLLQTGAKAADENLEGMTALHLASKEGHIRVIQSLKGALDWKSCSRKNGLTALHVASSCGQMECVSELLTQIPAGIRSERPLSDPNADYGITPLHLAAQNGHEGVVRLLMNSPGVLVDASTQIHGTIPMHLAAQGGHMLVAGLVISRSAESLFKTDKQGRTCVHLASAYGQRDMVGLLLGQGAEINAADKKLWTPLHYAARYGYLDVVQLLVDSGADPTATSKQEKIALCCAAKAGHYPVLSYLLSKEHDSLQLMEDKSFLLDLMNCAKNHENKPLREFILVSEAPIHTAVRLAKCFESLAVREKERSKDLIIAQKFCDQLSIELLSIAATTNNAGAILRAYDSSNVEFLDVLIELERKDVVSQHAVQRYLTELWMGGLHWSTFRFVALFFAFLLCPPFWALISTPLHFNRLHRVPIIKFLSYLTAHIFFILLLTYSIVFPNTKIYEYTHLRPLWNEWLLGVWLVGLLVSDLMNPSDRSGLGVIRVAIQLVGFAAILLHLLAFLFFTFMVDTQDDPQWARARLDTLYARNQLLAVVMLFSFFEFLNFLTFHPLFGPWGVIIQELIQDLMRFLALLSIFLGGFTMHICAIYQPVYENPNSWNNTIPPLGQEFIVPHKSFEMLFYALFGLVEPDNMPPMHLSPPFSKVIIKLVFGIYMTVTLIVLINLLIAMMSNTYQRIEAQSDIEWKFGRAKLIRNMNRTLSTPSPINLLLGIPMVFLKKLELTKKHSDLSFARQAFGHLASDGSHVARQWMDRRASKTSKISRLSRGTIMTNIYGLSLVEAGFDESKPINQVVNWHVIVRKYYELVGLKNREEEHEEVRLNEPEDEKLEPN